MSSVRAEENHQPNGIHMKIDGKEVGLPSNYFLGRGERKKVEANGMNGAPILIRNDHYRLHPQFRRNPCRPLSHKTIPLLPLDEQVRSEEHRWSLSSSIFYSLLKRKMAQCRMMDREWKSSQVLHELQYHQIAVLLLPFVTRGSELNESSRASRSVNKKQFIPFALNRWQPVNWHLLEKSEWRETKKEKTRSLIN